MVTTHVTRPAPTAPLPSDGVWARERRPLTVGLVLAVTLVAFEALAVATVLPVVSRHLGDLRLYGWVFSAFLLSSLAGIVVAGTLADRHPLGKPMLAGLGLFAVGLVIGGTAPDMPVLVAGRVIQGLGAGVVPAVAYVAISRGYPAACRPRMFAVLSTAWVVPGLIGPAVAALVADAIGWRWVFLGLLPLVGVAGLLGTLALRRLPAPASGGGVPVPYLPVVGVVAGAGLALASISSGDLATSLAGGALGVVVLVTSLRRLTPARTLTAGRGLPATILSRGLLTCCFYAGDAYVPYALVVVRHSPTALGALALTASTLSWTAASWVQARYVSRVGPRLLVRTGESILLVGFGLMVGALFPLVPPWFGVVAWAVAGAGIGLSYSPLSLATLDRAPAGKEGSATSGLQLCDVLGQAIGTGVGGALIGVVASGLGHRSGVGLAFAFGIALGIAALVVSPRVPDALVSGQRRDVGQLAGSPAHGAEGTG